MHSRGGVIPPLLSEPFVEEQQLGGNDSGNVQDVYPRSEDITV